MTAQDYQKTFAQILTNSKLRQDLYNKKTGSFEHFLLDEEELNNLLLLDNQLVEEYSRMISATRLNMILGVLPVTKRLLPDNFVEQTVYDYENSEPPLTVIGSPTIAEVKRFARYIEKSSLFSGNLNLLLKNVGKYEINKFLLSSEFSLNGQDNNINSRNPDKNFLASRLICNEKIKIIHFDYDIIDILSKLKLENTINPKPVPTILIFFSPVKTVKVKRISQLVLNLIEFCTGSFDVDEICTQFLEKNFCEVRNVESTRIKVINILKELTELNILISKK
jgi:hypothetical protein